MSAAGVRVIGSTRDKVGECPVWDADAQALYWVDIEGRAIRRLDGASGQVQSWRTAERVGCIALTARNNSLLAAMESGVFELELQTAPEVRSRLIAPARHGRAGMRFNDGRCDAEGRFWVGSMVMDMGLAAPDGALHVLDRTGLSAPVVSGLVTPNGLAFSGDGRRAWLSDSHPSVQQIWTFSRDPATGALSERRPWVDMRGLPGRPDGAAVDAEDHYWICANDAGLVHRFSPAGELLQSIPVPVPKPSMCCFGGPGLRTLFVTSIQPGGQQTALDGALLAIEVQVAGRPEPRFSRYPETPGGASFPFT
jgi:sugar lactone lactonase YvrE